MSSNSTPATADSIALNGTSLTPQMLDAIADKAPVSLCPDALGTMSSARRIIEQAIEKRQPVYGVTTGLGPRVTQAMPDNALDGFSIKTIRGRAHGVGKPLDVRWVRAGMAARANTLLIGAAGAHPAMAEHIIACLNANITPVIPQTGTIGVADLTWGGAFGLALIGEGRMFMPDNSIVNSNDAMASVGINAFAPQPREGLALVSHSTITAGMAALGWVALNTCYQAAQTSAALSMEGFRANLSPLDERVLHLRPQPGQLAAALELRQSLAGSILFNKGAARRLQDPLSIRNIAQVHGSVNAMLSSLADTLQGELNGASDNPAVIVDDAEVLSHGGYLPIHLNLMLNSTTQAFVHLAALQVSRISKLLFERFSGLENGLTLAGAEGAGLGPLMKPAEALYAEIAQLAVPAPIYPGISADGLEDIVTHTAIPAKNIFEIAARLRHLTAIEAIVATQAIEIRKISSQIARPLHEILQTVRSVSELVDADRPLGEEIDQIALLIDQGAFAATA